MDAWTPTSRACTYLSARRFHMATWCRRQRFVSVVNARGGGGRRLPEIWCGEPYFSFYAELSMRVIPMNMVGRLIRCPKLAEEMDDVLRMVWRAISCLSFQSNAGYWSMNKSVSTDHADASAVVMDHSSWCGVPCSPVSLASRSAGFADGRCAKFSRTVCRQITLTRCQLW